MTSRSASAAGAAPVLEFATIDSTNAEAKRQAESGRLGPQWLRADMQSSGRGREGREWFAPEGNLYATLLTPFDKPPQCAALMSFVACLAVTDLLDAFTGAPDRTSLKWPNDALLDGRKVSGVLLEAGGDNERRWLAVGIGVNLAFYPGDVRWPAISVAEATGRPAPLPRIAMGILADTFARWHATFLEEGFGPVRRAWLARAAHLGDPIEARLPKVTLTGTFEGIGEDGTLLLGSADGHKRIAAADVHFPDQTPCS